MAIHFCLSSSCILHKHKTNQIHPHTHPQRWWLWFFLYHSIVVPNQCSLSFTNVTKLLSEALLVWDQHPNRKIKENLTVQHVQTYKRLKRMLFIRTRQNQQIFGEIPFVKLQDDKSETVKNDEKWSEKLNHLSVSGWAMLFFCPVFGRMLAWQFVLCVWILFWTRAVTVVSDFSLSVCQWQW